MIQSKFLRKISFVVLLSFCFTTFLTPFNIAKASNTKTLIITFSTNPTYASVSKTKLKYNKDFALSYSFDDGNIRGYDTAFKYMNGGYSDYLGQYFGGLYFTDGAGNNVPFRGGFAFYSRNSSYTDIHVNTPSYVNWTQLQDAVDNGWNVFNHGYTSTTLLPGDPNDSYYTGDPGGHSIGALDYNYELTQNNVEIASHISLKNNAGSVTGPLNMSHVVLPNGDSNYIQPAFNANFKGVFAQSNAFVFDGSTVNIPDYINISNPINTDHLVMYRLFDNEDSYLPSGPRAGGLFNYVDQLASASTGVDKHWAQEFTHQITTSTYAPDWNGGMTWTSWKSLMDHIENTYGRFGNDKAWVAGAEEVYNYMVVKQNSVLTQNLVGNQLTVNIDVSGIPSGLTNYALSLLVDSDAIISSINYGSDFTYNTDNKSTGLINLDWGTNSYSKNDITRVETLVSAAETSKRKSDIDVARNYAVLLPTGTTKTSFVERLDKVVVPLRTWYVNIKGGITFVNDCSSTNASTYAPSIYNWNSFYVGKSPTLCDDLLNLKDGDGQSSSLSLSNTASFSGNLQMQPTGDNSGIYPDGVIEEGASIYGPESTPGKVKISGLENTKTYNIKLFGYTSNDANLNNKDYVDYSIGGTTKSLLIQGNISNTVEFTDVLPTSGYIEVSVVPKVPNWGYGMLNAMEIKENILAAPSSLSYTTPNTYTINSAIASISPTVTGLGITYSVSPSLPSGLSLDTSTGVISGTPVETSGRATYTVTATNAGGSTAFGVVLTINEVAPSSLSYSIPDAYTRGTAIASLTPTVTGQNIVYSVSPSLPAGLSLNTSTGVIGGIPTGVANLNTYTITASNSGGSITFDVTMTVNDIPISTPSVSPSVGVYNSTQNITLSSTGSDYIKYATDALPATCGDGTLYSGTIEISSSQTIYVRACNILSNSSTASFAYIIDTISPEVPLSSVTAGSYNTTQSITLSSAGSSYIKYATDALPSSCSTGTSYTGAISIDNSITIYARACDDAGNSSSTSFAYVIDNTDPLTPIVSIPSGTYNSTQSITLSSSGSNYIKYATDALPSSCSTGTSYTGAISISTTTTVYVRACDDAGNSSTASFAYIIDTISPEVPLSSVTAGSYNTTQSITLSSAGSSYIKYATDALPSSCSTGTSYTGAISISTTTTVYVRACDDAGNSSTTSFIYNISNNNDLITYLKYSIISTPLDCSSGELYSDSLTFASSTKLYMRVCNLSDNSSISTFEYITPKSSGNISSGSSGGSSRYYPPVVNTTAIVSTPVISVTPPISTTSISTPIVSLIQKIKKDLEIGMRNKDVKTLQLFLISQNKGQYSRKLSVNGATIYFGKLTKQALAEWQKNYKIYPASGYFGAKTRAKIKALGL